ncbi:hypothetical protein ABT160_41785 [Streptomyces sp. NPDC001941]|uniref:hypothetical protein n=1 Tax=Streptomyces sp. NPDC001941 TaxID=3154659 RepID=UPI00332DDE6C
MRPERSNGTSGGGLAVPMAWLCAEYTADELLRTGCLVAPGSLEYLAGRRTLALTVFLCDATDESAGVRALARLEEWLSLTAYGHPWQEWVREELAAREAACHGGEPGPDLALALEAWRWLGSTELLAADLGEPEPWPPAHPASLAVDETAQVWMPAWKLGVPLGHLSIHLF